MGLRDKTQGGNARCSRGNVLAPEQILIITLCDASWPPCEAIRSFSSIRKLKVRQRGN